MALSWIKKNKIVSAFIAVLWLFLFFATISKAYFMPYYGGSETDRNFIFIWAFLIWSVVIAFVPLFIWLIERKPIDHTAANRLSNVMFHLILCLAVIPIHALLFPVIMIIFDNSLSFNPEILYSTFSTVAPWMALIDPFAYWLVIGGYYLNKYSNQYKLRQLQNLELQAELAAIHLHVLKFQFHPHFLFNTLHNINSLIYEDPSRAERILGLLKKLLSTSINLADQQEVTLAEELDQMNTYTQIEETRFGKNLKIKTEIDPGSLTALVPSLILQPLVENSVKHGISKRARPGTIKVVSKVEGEELVLLVDDDGPGFPADQQKVHYGIGLRNNKQRLDHLFHNYEFSLESSPMGGARVRVTIPLKQQHNTEIGR